MAKETTVGAFRIRLQPDEFSLWSRVRVDVQGTPVSAGRKVVVDAETGPFGDRVKVDVVDPYQRSVFSTVVGSDREVERLVALGTSQGDIVEIGAGLLELLAAAKRDGFDPSTVMFTTRQTDEMFGAMGEVAAAFGRGTATQCATYCREIAANSNWGRDDPQMPLFAVLSEVCASFRRGVSGSDQSRYPKTDSYLKDMIVFAQGILVAIPEANPDTAGFRTALSGLVEFAGDILRDGRIESKEEGVARYGDRIEAARVHTDRWSHQIQTTTGKSEIAFRHLAEPVAQQGALPVP